MVVKHIKILILLTISINVYSQKWQYNTPPDSFLIDTFKLNTAWQLIDKHKVNTLDSCTLLPEVNKQMLLQDLTFVLQHPNKNQLGYRGYYCGPAAVLNWFINNHPDLYVKAVLDLALDGKTQITEHSPVIKLPRALRKRVDYSSDTIINGRPLLKDLDSIRISNFVLGVSLVHSEKAIQKIGLIFPNATYKKSSPGNFIYSNTGPWEINDYLKKLGASVEQQAYYLGDSEDIEDLRIIEKAVNQGKMPILFDNHSISYRETKNAVYKMFGAHYFTIHSFSINEEENTVNFSYWDYAKVKNNPYHNPNYALDLSGNLKKSIRRYQKAKKKQAETEHNDISIEEFLKGLKGYWIAGKELE